MNIKLKDIGKSYGKGFAVEHLNLEIKSGNFTTLLGTSGCGKTTILRMISGLEAPDTGEIWFDDQCVFSDSKKINVSPEKRNLGFVFQDFALWPHMTVFENVAYSLRAKKCTKLLKERVDQALKSVQLDNLSERYPHQLSGGQQQRVAFARTIVGRPKCVLFDEPLSALDAILRDEMRIEIKRLTAELGVTSVFVTHDQAEAMSMSDEIVVISNGVIEQQGAPEDIYNWPKTKFVAQFIGKSNWFDEKTMVRPETISLCPEKDSVEFKTKVLAVQFLGSFYELALEVKGFKWSVMSHTRVSPNDEISVFINKGKILQFS